MSVRTPLVADGAAKYPIHRAKANGERGRAVAQFPLPNLAGAPPGPPQATDSAHADRWHNRCSVG